MGSMPMERQGCLFSVFPCVVTALYMTCYQFLPAPAAAAAATATAAATAAATRSKNANREPRKRRGQRSPASRSYIEQARFERRSVEVGNRTLAGCPSNNLQG